MVVVVAEELRYTVEASCRRCTLPLVSIVTHGSRWVWISLYRLLPLPWKVPIVPHCHICPRVSLLTVLLFMWGFHLITINFPTELLAFRIFNPLKMDSCSKQGRHQTKEKKQLYPKRVKFDKNKIKLNKIKHTENTKKYIYTRKFTKTCNEDHKCSTSHHSHLGTILGNDTI